MPTSDIKEQIINLESLVVDFEKTPTNYMSQSVILRTLYTGSSRKQALLKSVAGFRMPLFKKLIGDIGDKSERSEGLFLPGLIETKNVYGGRLMLGGSDWQNGRLGIEKGGGIELAAKDVKGEKSNVDVSVSRVHDMFDEKLIDLDGWLSQRFLRPECTVAKFIIQVANTDGGAHVGKHSVLLRSLQRFNRLQNCIIYELSKETCNRLKFFLTENDFGPVVKI